MVAVRPDLVYGARPALEQRELEIRPGVRKGTTHGEAAEADEPRAFFAAVLLVALLVAGVGSYYASAHPDGLNFVAEKTGFSTRRRTRGTSDGPFAGYQTSGIDDARLSGGVAGVLGCLLVLTLAGGLPGRSAAAARLRTPRRREHRARRRP